MNDSDKDVRTNANTEMVESAENSKVQVKKTSNIKSILIKIAAGLMVWYLLYSNLDPIAKYITYNLLGLVRSSHFASSVEFFIFEVPKVILLLVIVIFFVGIIRSFFTAERTRAMLAGKSLFAGNVMASALGIVTPFCTCSAIPLFIGFMEAGVPLGVTFSFLISAPMINEVALVMLYGMFGVKVAGLYLATGLLIAITSGYVIGKLKLEKYVEEWVYEVKMGSGETNENVMLFEDRVNYGLDAVKEIVLKVWPYITIGIAVGAGIHGYVPENQIASFMGKDTWWAVPLAVLLGVPMYSNAAGIIPVVQALMGKGAALGTVLAFMMAVIGLSLPEVIILKKVLKWQLISAFVGVVACGIILVGYLFNFLI